MKSFFCNFALILKKPLHGDGYFKIVIAGFVVNIDLEYSLTGVVV